MKWMVMITMILLILLFPMPPIIKGIGIFAQIVITIVKEDDDGDSNKESE